MSLPRARGETPRIATWLPVWIAGALLLVWTAACRALPFPIAATGSPFPGSALEPYSARAAGSALAEFWLEGPEGNPAAALGETGMSVSGLFLSLNRQDLRAAYRQFDEAAGTFEIAGVRIREASFAVPLAAYLVHPVRRDETQAYLVGDVTAPPAARRAHFSVRETRAGLAAAWPWTVAEGRFAAGVAGEWLRREDHYGLEESSAALSAGTSKLDWDGETWAFQAGARWEGRGPEKERRLAAGLAWRHTGPLDLSGTRSAQLAGGDTVEDLAVEREPIDQLGASLQAEVHPAITLTVGAGWSGRERYPGIAAGGTGAIGSLSLHYHDARDPWAAWVGFGEQQQRGVPEPRAGLLGVGFSWSWKQAQVEGGALRRTIDVATGPRSFDYRLLGTLRVAF